MVKKIKNSELSNLGYKVPLLKNVAEAIRPSDIKDRVKSRNVIEIDSSIDGLMKKYEVKELRSIFKKRFVRFGRDREFRRVDRRESEFIKIKKLKIEGDVLNAVREFSENPNVEYAEPNYLYSLDYIPNDPSYNEQWAHQNMRSEQAWDIERGDPGVVIAIVDSGVDYNHEDLATNIWANPNEILNGEDDDNNGYIDDIRGWDFHNEDNDPMDDQRHGTHVAGIAAGVGNNGLGISGLCPRCSIMPLKASNAAGSFPQSASAEAVVYAADNNAQGKTKKQL